jgi:hypothetical protein
LAAGFAEEAQNYHLKQLILNYKHSEKSSFMKISKGNLKHKPITSDEGDS